MATSPALPAFSYAQAAKGLAPSTLASSNVLDSSQRLSESKESKTPAGEPSGLELSSHQVQIKDDDSAQAASGKARQVDQGSNAASSNLVDKENIPPSKRGASSGEDTKLTVSETSSPSLGPLSSGSAKGDDTANETSENWEKHSQASASVEKAVQTPWSETSKEQENDWDTLPPSKPMAKEELKVAPLPAVNFWQARMEAQEAKAKALAAQRPQPVSNPAPKQKPANPESNRSQKELGEDGKRKSQTRASNNSQREDGPPTRKSGDRAKLRDDARRQSSRTGASNEDGKEHSTETIPPPVGDAQLWPTPELALSEDRKKSTSQDRVEKPEGKDKSETKSSSSKPAQKIWVQMPYVPSAKFVTPLPPAASRRGAKPAIQGGRREDTERGARAVNNGAESDKSGPANMMGPPPRPRPGDDQDRGRDQEAAGSDRATSAPSQPRRAASASAVPAEQRKRLTLSNKDRNGNEYKTDASGNPPHSNGGSADKSTRQSFGPRSESKSSRPFQPSDQSSRRGSIETSRQSSIPGDAHSHPKYDAPNRRSMPADFYGSPDNLGQTQYPYFPREQESTRYRHTPRDKSDFSRENVSTWRDRDARPEREGRSDSRPERGRGSYRGRASHQTYDTTLPSPHAYTAPLPQQPFSSSKSHSFHSGLRQTSQPYPTLSLQSGQYPTARSHSIPNSGMYPAMASPIPAMHQSMSPIQTEMPIYGFQPALHPAFIGPVPYNPALQTMGILQMVKNQVEYYFSIDNLCKDMFLRQNMDSQGYVLLSVIGGFARIRALKVDMEMLRHVCSQLTTIDFRPGEDGIDRLRTKEGWEQWVRPMNERVSSAQNDGPPSPPPFRSQTDETLLEQQISQSAFGAVDVQVPTLWKDDDYFQTDSLPPNDTVVERQLTENQADTSVSQPVLEDSYELSNGKQVMATQPAMETDSASQSASRESLSNGHRSTELFKPEDNAFPDHQISALTVVVRQPDAPNPAPRPHFMSTASRTFSHGSIDEQSFSSDVNTNTEAASALPNLRGGSGTLEQLDRGRSRTNVPNHISHLNYQADSLPVFWIKDGAPLMELHQEGLAHEPYHSLRSRAFEQRLFGNSAVDMEVLYQFWSHFLIRNFNVAMYEEFHTLASEDSARGAENGLKHLIRFYEALLAGKKPLADGIAADLVDLIQMETDAARPAFHKLRAAWRDGAFNLRSRKKVATFLTSELRAELER